MNPYTHLIKLTNIAVLATIPLLFGCANLTETLSASGSNHFRKTRWGYTQEMVLVAEQGKRLFLRKGNTLVFNHRIGDVPLKIVYTFKNNRLRAAGYITDRPVKGADKLVDHTVKELGEPSKKLEDEMIWLDDETLVYLNAYTSQIIDRGGKYKASGGIFNLLEPPEEEEEEKETETLWDGVWAYIDLDFYIEMREVDFPLDEMSLYEKQLFGVLKRRTIKTYITNSGKLSISGELPISDR